MCVGNLTTISPDNSLAPTRRQAIILTNAGILFICPIGTNVSDMLIEIHTFSFKKMEFDISSAKLRPSRLDIIVLITIQSDASNTRNPEQTSNVQLILVDRDDPL